MHFPALLLCVLGVPALAVEMRSTFGRGPSPEPMLLPSNGTFNSTFATTAFQISRNYTESIPGREPNWYDAAYPFILNYSLADEWALSVAVSAPNASFNASTAETNTITSEITLVWPAGELGPDAQVNPGNFCVIVVPGLEKFNDDTKEHPYINVLSNRESADADTQCWSELLNARDWKAEGNQTFAEAGCGRTGFVTVPKACRSYKNCAKGPTYKACSKTAYTLSPTEGNITMYSFARDSLKRGEPFMHRVDVGFDSLANASNRHQGAIHDRYWPVIIQNTWEGNASVEPLAITVTKTNSAEVTIEGGVAIKFWTKYDLGVQDESAASPKDLGMGVAMWTGGLALLLAVFVSA